MASFLVTDYLKEPAKQFSSVEDAARLTHVPEDLLRAVIRVESNWNPWAFNPEPKWRWMWDVQLDKPFRKLTSDEIDDERPPADFPKLYGDQDQEWWLQQASIGWMQTMGAVVREMGCREPSLLFLVNPGSSLYYGAHYLRRLGRKHFEEHGWEGVIRAYNTGQPDSSSAGDRYLRKVIMSGFREAELPK